MLLTVGRRNLTVISSVTVGVPGGCYQATLPGDFRLAPTQSFPLFGIAVVLRPLRVLTAGEMSLAIEHLPSVFIAAVCIESGD